MNNNRLKSQTHNGTTTTTMSTNN